ncbi:hypothetical protein LIER_10864 [Lithospermum erythrorhizon]|uniref:Uncharacterized protein n=1 Tax=Lithospermum erythrorhizon TaxID=34254 RepID=A0AAV3PKS2_LITER
MSTETRLRHCLLKQTLSIKNRNRKLFLLKVLLGPIQILLQLLMQRHQLLQQPSQKVLPLLHLNVYRLASRVRFREESRISTPMCIYHFIGNCFSSENTSPVALGTSIHMHEGITGHCFVRLVVL